jgi:hypothetical protein
VAAKLDDLLCSAPPLLDVAAPIEHLGD